MNEGIKARIRIVSRMKDADGNVHEIKNARSGLLRCTAQETVLEYDDVQDEERAHIVLEMKHAQGKEDCYARMLRKGMVSSVLTFIPGRKIASSYVTLYGEIPVAVDTRCVKIEKSDCGGHLLLDYDVYVGGERTSGARMEITWRM